MSLRLEDDKMCWVCGTENAHGLKLKFEHPEIGLLKATHTFRKEHQGYKEIVHGGMLATVLDEMIVNLAWIEGEPVVTGELTVRLKKPARVGEPVHFEGRITERKGRILRGKAEARDAAGELLAEATASCVRIRVDAAGSGAGL